MQRVVREAFPGIDKDAWCADSTWTIDSYIVRPPQQHYDNHTAPAAVSASHAISLKTVKHKKMKTCYKAIHEILNGSNSTFSRRCMVQYLPYDPKLSKAPMAVFDLCYPLATHTFTTIVQVIAESTAALYPGFLLR